MNYKARQKGNIPEASAWHLVLGKRSHSSKEEKLRKRVSTLHRRLLPTDLKSMSRLHNKLSSEKQLIASLWKYWVLQSKRVWEVAYCLSPRYSRTQIHSLRTSENPCLHPGALTSHWRQFWLQKEYMIQSHWDFQKNSRGRLNRGHCLQVQWFSKSSFLDFEQH